MPTVASQTRDDERVDMKTYTWDDVRDRAEKEKCLIVIDGLVYDVATWLPKHPGGELVIVNARGCDVTDLFNAYHPPAIRKMLAVYLVGKLENYDVDAKTKKYRDLAASIESSALMIVRPGFYFKLICWYISLLTLSVSCVILGRDSFWVSIVVGGVVMAAYLQQIAFFGHDLGHSSVFHSRKIDSLVGLIVGNVCSGISMGWWKATHNAHHCATNSIEGDPDIQHGPIFAVSAEQVSQPIKSVYHEKFLNFGFIAKLLIPVQSRLYYLVMCLARVNLYLQSYIFILRGSAHVRKRVHTNSAAELIGLLCFAAWFSLLLIQIPYNTWRLFFVLISHSLAGILHVQITLSHFTMKTYFGKHPLGEDTFLEQQLKTCLDVDCPTSHDYFHGGLQHQLPHHLFPRVPRCNLRDLREVLKSFFEDNNLAYSHLDFISANKLLLHHLSKVSDECKTRFLKDFVNARG
jgi:fatty acid desaturase